MANSKHEYVKSLEEKEEILLPNIVVVHIYGSNFRRFSEVHKFLKPNDKRVLELMNDCAKAILEKFPDIMFSYGFSDEYSFVFKKDTEFYRRRASKLFTLVTSYFLSTYIFKWKDFFPQMELQFPPSFTSQVFGFPQIDVLQQYLAWRQLECHLGSQCSTCLWELIRNGKTEQEAQEILKGTGRKDEYELLYQEFNINYEQQEPISQQGTCILRTEVEVIVKEKHDGSPVQRPKMKLISLHSENIASRSFWNGHSRLVRDLGHFEEEINEIKPEYLKSFLHGSKLTSSGWIVIRIDGCHFRRFSEDHEFEKPNDARALNLMNSCAVSVLEEFKDIVFSYGVSDEYSEIVSAVVCLFSSMYAMKWEEFFPQKELKYPPYFDGRTVCYPTTKILLDYLAWRQVDCHINNQYNTCFWMLVKSGKSTSEAYDHLKGTNAEDKNKLLTKLTGIGDYYNTLPLMFRRGSSVFWDKGSSCNWKLYMPKDAGEGYKVVVEHISIIDKGFWQAHPKILGEKPSC